MKLTIVGGGNVGTQLATHGAEKGHEVTVYTSKPERFQNELTVINENNDIIHQGRISRATNDPEEAFKNAEFIFVTYPAFEMSHIAEIILPYVYEGMKICIVPGTGGGECSFKSHIEKGAVVCGLQRVPSVARIVEYGKTVRAVGYRDELHLAAIPGRYTEECCGIISQLLDKKCTPLPNYLNNTMTPSNPILHTTRLYTLFRDYKPGVVYDNIPLFYQEWSDETSRLLFLCDNEVQNICASLEEFDLSGVRSLKEHYESPTPEALTRKIQSIEGFKGLKTPYIETEEGLIPDLNSRYFTADFPYGLDILIQIAEQTETKVPNMKKVMDWYNQLAGTERQFSFDALGINIREFYKQ